jgi:hypothetical protein
MERTFPLVSRLSRRLTGRREIDVGNDIKVAHANADEVLVDFPKKIEHDEILVDFPQRSYTNLGYYYDDDECGDVDNDNDDDEDCGFLGFPKGGRKSFVAKVVDRPSADDRASSHPSALPETIDIPARRNDGNLGTHNVMLTKSFDKGHEYEEPGSWVGYDKPEKSWLMGEVRICEAQVAPMGREKEMDDQNVTKEPSNLLQQKNALQFDEKSVDHAIIVDEAGDVFRKPSNWIDDEESDSDEDSETYRQRILSQIAERASSPALDASVSNLYPQEPPQPVPRAMPGRTHTMRRSSMPLRNTAPSFDAGDMNGPFSQGFDFAKQLPTPQPMARRRSLVDTTYEFEKGLEVQPKSTKSRRTLNANNDANLLLGLKAFGAKDHDIRRIMS